MRGMLRRKLVAIPGTILLILALLYPVVAWYVAGQALTAEASPYDQVPGELGMTYEDVSFSPRGEAGITLRGWWFPTGEEPRAAVIWVHGLDGTQADRLPLVADLVALGYAVLTFDLRGHGQSDPEPMGGAIREQRDVLGAVDHLLGTGRAEEGEIFLVGQSYGAATILLTGYQEQAVAGVFADSAFSSMGELIAKEVADRTFLPEWAARTLKPGLIVMARFTKGLDINQAAPESVVEEYAYPLGFAVCDADERIPPGDTWKLRTLATGDSDYTSFPGCGHADAYADHPDLYVEVLTTYLDRRLAS